jgi:drug/metabolite transporter (DMT)-like permease
MVSHRGIGYALAAAGVSGAAVFVNGLAVRHFDDATVYTTAKNLLAGTVLAAVLLAAVARESDRGAEARVTARRFWPQLTAIAVIGGAVPFVLFFEGLARATSTNAAFIHKTLVVWVAIGATVMLREQLSAVHVAAIGLLVGGHLVLTGGLGAVSFGSAELLVLSATLLWAVEVLVVKRLLADVPARLAATARMTGGSVLLVAWLALTGRLGELAALDARQWLWILLTGSTLAAFVGTWYTALSLAPAIDVTAVLVLGAVVTGVLDAGFRDVPLTTDSAGYVLIAIGALAVAARAIAERPDRRRVAA